MSWLSKFLDPGAGYRDAQKEQDKYNQMAHQFYQQGQQYQQPYANYGQEVHAPLNNAMMELMNPQALQDKWTSGYQQSAASKQDEERARQHGLNAASSLGLSGSQPALEAIQAGTSNIGMQDRDNYLNSLMQKYLSGIGVAGNMFNTGANAASNMGGNAMQMGQNAMRMGENASQNRFNESNAPGDMFGKLLGVGAGLAGSALGGPIGGALGAGLGQKMGWSEKGSYNPSPQNQPWRIQ